MTQLSAKNQYAKRYSILYIMNTLIKAAKYVKKYLTYLASPDDCKIDVM